MKSKIILAFLLCLLLSNSIFSQEKPNIILIIADDMGWTQVSTGIVNLNNPSDFYETPRLEELASQGIAFPHGYVNGANCAPTRAAILTGQHASRPTNNVFNVDDLNRGNKAGNSTLIGSDMGLESGGVIYDQIPSSAITLAERLRDDEGYVTAHFGKLHVGEDSWNTETTFGNDAYEQGFDYNYGGGADGGPGDYHASLVSTEYQFHENVGPQLDIYASPYTLAEETALVWDGYNLGNLPNNVPLAQATNFNANWSSVTLENQPKNVNDAMADAAISFMNAENDEAFFMHFSNFAVHGPTDDPNPRPDLLAKYTQKLDDNPNMDHKNVGLAAILENMDQTIGRIVDYLKATDDPRWPGHKLSENTLIYFLSDNGGVFKNTTENSNPLRGMKGEYYEGGIRSVTIAWSEASWLANKGTVNNTPVVGFDVFPTFIDMARGNVPASHGLDGESLWPILNGASTSLSRDNLFWHFPGYLIDNSPLRNQRPVTVVRNGDYKLIHNYETADYELYNLADDIEEEYNLLPSDDQATIDLANDIIDDMIDYLNDVNAPLPTFRSDGSTVSLPMNVTLTPVDYCEAVSGYEAYWTFNDDSANDVSGNTNNPITTLSSSITYDSVDFIEGTKSIVFDGSTGIEYASYKSDGTNTNAFLNAATSAKTIAVWIKPDNLSGLQNIFEEGNATDGIAIRLSNSKLQSIIRTSSADFSSIESNYPNDDEWHHIAMFYDGNNGGHTLYIDGKIVASESGGSVPTTLDYHNAKGGIAGKISNNDSFVNSSDNAYFTGKMDAFAVYDNALTEVEIEQMNPTWYLDNDGDGYGDSSSFMVQCAQPLGYVRNDSDCNDSSSSINPNAEEIAGNAIDEDCDGIAQNTLAIDEFSLTNVLIYPNPFQNEIKIRLSSELKYETFDVVLFDVHGRVIFRKSVKSSENDIYISENIDKLSEGIYFLKINSEGYESSVIKKLIKFKK